MLQKLRATQILGALRSRQTYINLGIGVLIGIGVAWKDDPDAAPDPDKIVSGDKIMNWFIDTFRTSLGKKLLMAVTGLGFLGFIIVHLLGNLTLYAGHEGVFNAYVAKLHQYEALILVAEIGLFALAVIHVTTGLLLFLANRSARSVRYAVTKSGGGRTVGSATMPYTGLAILLFVILHLSNFTFADVTDRTMYDVVAATFSSWIYIIVYVAAVVAVAIHVRHGFWSLFQTIGLNHEKYMPALRAISVALAVILGVGFGLIPIYIGIIV